MNQALALEAACTLMDLTKGIMIVLIGPLNIQLGYLLLVICLDFILGIKLSKKNKNFRFKTTANSVIEKLIVYGIWISIWHSVDMVTSLPGTSRLLCIMALLGHEILSAIKKTKDIGYGELSQSLSSVFTLLMKNDHKRR